ncbi:MAG: hypothetical protein MKZ95_03335 [Pirellulales bacterium]|nr:hypothetical protein [Pirellulales bacterium]
MVRIAMGLFCRPHAWIFSIFDQGRYAVWKVSLLARIGVGARGGSRYTSCQSQPVFMALGSFNLWLVLKKSMWQFWRVFLLSTFCATSLLDAVVAFAQSGTRESKPQADGPKNTAVTMLAAPIQQPASPFRPLEKREYKLPVALNGFCAVTLRDGRQWLEGQKKHQLVFDGQIYWFSSDRQWAIFVASPQRYVPALRGDCVVTYHETGKRIPGKIDYGLVHKQRMFFFSSKAHQKLFQSSPQRYDHVDLACEGQCIVSEVESGLKLPGMPETLVIVDGLQYLFAGAQPQAWLLADMNRYGVNPSPIKAPIQQPRALPVEKSTTQEAAATPLPGQEDSPEDSTTATLAMQGYCPVTIHQSGLWKNGSTEFQVNLDGKQYLFLDAATHTAFQENPSRYLPALGGDCPVTMVTTGARVHGSVYHPINYKGRLYLLAGESQSQTFKAEPTAYADVDMVDGGNCVVTYVEENQAVAGSPEFETWYHGMRYRFASADKQSQFQKDPAFYEQRKPAKDTEVKDTNSESEADIAS